MERNVAMEVSAAYGQREIADWAARAIGAAYHDGSALTLAFVSTGTIPTQDDQAEPLWHAFFPDFYALSADEQKAANMLGTYLVKNAGRGKVEGWADLSW